MHQIPTIKSMNLSLTKPRATPAAGSLLAAIGNTPLLKLERIAEDLPGIEIYAKAEYFNPGGSDIVPPIYDDNALV